MSSSDFRIRRQPPLAAQVFETLRTMMQAHVFEPGERMVEEDLARRLAVSRTPVREALFRLEQNGMLEQRDGGFHVPRLTLRDVEEIFQIRRLLEPQGVADVAAATTDGDLAAYIAGRDRMLAADSEQAAVQANIAFRGLWLARIPNQRMQDVLMRFDDQVVLVRHATLRSAQSRLDAAQGVSRLVEAFAARDPVAARRVMESFIDSAFSHFHRAVTEPAPAPPATQSEETQ
ncbi:GntR family transcriptional regulator [Gemmobacter sp.]|uniref:GntR family transcriptional regulator n=1 Tax=Gemmobacter sp. TaxID=1898957 RepID=UPI002AFDCC44|nr:GntR family transcriptional regulator [Gemmobacter sp.]